VEIPWSSILGFSRECWLVPNRRRSARADLRVSLQLVKYGLTRLKSFIPWTDFLFYSQQHRNDLRRSSGGLPRGCRLEACPRHQRAGSVLQYILLIFLSSSLWKKLTLAFHSDCWVSSALSCCSALSRRLGFPLTLPPSQSTSTFFLH
jgi:hypothetical protein